MELLLPDENIDTPKPITKMNKKELYDEVKSLRIEQEKFKEIQSQINQCKEDIQFRQSHIQNLQNDKNDMDIMLNEFYSLCDKKTVDKLSMEKGGVLKHDEFLKILQGQMNWLNNKELQELQDKYGLLFLSHSKLKYEHNELQGNYADVINNPIIVHQSSEQSVDKVDIYDRIAKLFKDKIDAFDEVENENKKLKKIVNKFKNIFTNLDDN